MAAPRFLRSRSIPVLALLVLAAPVVCAAAESRQSLPTVTGEELSAALHPTEKRPVLVHLWASWCVSCVAEWPALASRLRTAAGRPLDIVVISIDDAADGAKAEKILARLGRVPGRLLLAPSGVAIPVIQALDPAWDGSIPTTYVLSGEGDLVLAERGGTRFDSLEEAIDRVAPATHPKAFVKASHSASKERKEP